MAADFEIETVVDDWQDVVTADDVDAVVIGTWPNLHCPVTLAALDADKHVLCEARIAMNATEARKMYAAAQAKSHLVTQVVPAPMTLTVDTTVERLISQGYLGNCLAIRLTAGGTFLDREAPLHWRQNKDLSGLNIMSMGIWYESLMRWVGEATQVFASGKIFQPERLDEDGVVREVLVPEHLDVVAEMACGAEANLQISTVTGHDDPPAIWLFGDEGTLHFTEGRLFGGRSTEASRVEIEIPATEAVGWRVEEEFIQSIRGEEQVRRTTFADGVRYMEFTEAVAKSLHSGRAEEVAQ